MDRKANKGKGKGKGKVLKKKKSVDTRPIDPSPYLIYIFRPEKRFNILPYTVFHRLISAYADMLPSNFTERYMYIERHFPITSPFAGIPTPPPLLSYPIDTINGSWSKDKSFAIRRANALIMKYRMAFRKLLHHMIFRKLAKANTEDLVTCEKPKKPVYITDWINRKIYIFEAQTLMKDITERLLHHDGFFEDTQEPRNPFTNLPLTYSQKISVWNSISVAGIPVSSAFTLFRHSRFLVKKFIYENIQFLRVNSLRKTLREANSFDYRERMIDFIEHCYSVESADCSVHSFIHALSKYPNHRLIKQWARLCEKYYECEIIHAGNPDKITLIKETVLDETYDLLHLQREIDSINRFIGNTVEAPPIIIEAIESLDFLYVDI